MCEFFCPCICLPRLKHSAPVAYVFVSSLCVLNRVWHIQRLWHLYHIWRVQPADKLHYMESRRLRSSQGEGKYDGRDLPEWPNQVQCTTTVKRLSDVYFNLSRWIITTIKTQQDNLFWRCPLISPSVLLWLQFRIWHLWAQFQESLRLCWFLCKLFNVK